MRGSKFVLALAVAGIASGGYLSGCITTGTSQHFSATATAVPSNTPAPAPPTAAGAANLASSSKTGPSSGRMRGTEAHYYIDVRNSGGSAATGVQVSDALDSGLDPGTVVFWSGPTGSVSGSMVSWNLGSVGAGQTVTLHFSVLVAGTATVGGVVCNSASITAVNATGATAGPACFTVVPASQTATITQTFTNTPTITLTPTGSPVNTVTFTNTVPATNTPTITPTPTLCNITIGPGGACPNPTHGTLNVTTAIQTNSQGFNAGTTVWYQVVLSGGLGTAYNFSLCQNGGQVANGCAMQMELNSSACSPVGVGAVCGTQGWEIAGLIVPAGTYFLRVFDPGCGNPSCYTLAYWQI